MTGKKSYSASTRQFLEGMSLLYFTLVCAPSRRGKNANSEMMGRTSSERRVNNDFVETALRLF